jgi:hypothetical protein
LGFGEGLALRTNRFGQGWRSREREREKDPAEKQ